MALTDQTPEEIAIDLWHAGLLEAVKAVEEEVSKITVLKDAQGRMSTFTEEMKGLGDNILSRRVDTYSYHESGEVNVINQKKFRGISELRHEMDVKHSINPKVRPKVTVKLEYIIGQYFGLTSTKTGVLIPPTGVTILPEDATVNSVEDGEPTANRARAVTRYAEKNVYDEKTGKIIDTETIAILGNFLSVTLNADDSYIMSNEPEDEQVAIMYFGEVKIENKVVAKL